ncbi:MAG: GxxExxY protein [Bacteroidales bacterium]|nr:MAG: GxxExxY protein [Bacteroidales bacterium]
MEKERYNYLGGQILDASIQVHKELGPGLLESVYQWCLFLELTSRGLSVKQEFSIPVLYKGQVTGKEFRIDLIVEDEIIIELKAVESILPVHEAQLITYLKLADKRLGYLINFNVPILKQGFKRYVNEF